MPARAYRVLVALCVAGALFVVACDTDPATDVGHHSATLHGGVMCGDGVYTVTVQHALRTVTGGEGPWNRVGAEVTRLCDNQSSQRFPLAAETVTGLEHGTEYEQRLDVVRVNNTASSDWYDSDGYPENGDNFDSFATLTVPSVASRPASDLRDSFGVNNRAAYLGTPHANYAKVKGALHYMGIRFDRDGLWPSYETNQWNFFRDISDEGVGATIGLGNLEDVSRPNTATPTVNDRIFDPSFRSGPVGTSANDKIAALKADPLVLSFIDAIESVNEPDHYTPFSGWPQVARDYQAWLWGLKSDPDFADKKIVGPSFAHGGQTQVGDVSQWLDFGNFHPYPGDDMPGINITARTADCKVNSVTKPCQATEVGYHTDLAVTGGNDGISEAVRSIYTPRLLLEHFRRGTRRVDLYTTVSQWCNSRTGGVEPDSADWGMYDCNWNPFPVAHALHRFTEAIGDGGEAGTYPLVFDAKPADAQSLVFTRADGSHAIALWRNVEVWNGTAQTFPSAQNAVIHLPEAGTVTLNRFVDGSTESLTPTPDRRVTVPLTGDPVVLEID